MDDLVQARRERVRSPSKTATCGWLSFFISKEIRHAHWILVIATALLVSCGAKLDETIASPPPTTVSAEASSVTPKLSLQTSWQIQYSGDMDYSLDVDIYNIDLFDTDAEAISKLKERGIFVMCYFSAGSYEDWRPDASNFPTKTLGKPMEGWEGETWLDIRQISELQPVMESRLDMAATKGCNGVDPDNVNGYENDTGFPLTYKDQIEFNIFLANTAHQRGLKIGLKNDLNQIEDLLPYFDWILNEECFSFDECDLLLPFVEAGKPAFVIEYELSPQKFCEQANQMNFNALHKNWELDAYRVACR